MEIKVSVRGLVEFLLRTGDIDNRKKSAPDDAMAEGSRIHRMIQKKMGSSYHAEVMLRYRRDCGEYDLVVEGRADGIIDSDPVAVDEIKGTYRDLSRMKEPNPVHLAQAKCYAWMYGQEHGKERMEVSMTYCNIETEEIRYFKFVYEMSDLEEWFDSLLQEYRKWSDADIAWKKLRQDSIHCPFRSRTGRDKKSWSRMFIIRSATAENCLSKHRPGRVRRFRRCFRQSRQSGKERRIGFFI